MLGESLNAHPKLCQTKDVKSYTYCCYVSATLIVWKGGKPWPQKGKTHYQAQLGLPDKGCAIKGLVVCYVVWLWSMGWVLGQVQGAWSSLLLESGWLSSSCTATHYIYKYISIYQLMLGGNRKNKDLCREFFLEISKGYFRSLPYIFKK